MLKSFRCGRFDSPEGKQYNPGMRSTRPENAATCLIELLETQSPFTRLPPGIHGQAHAYRVLLFTQCLCNMFPVNSRNRPDSNLLILAALLHDCGRLNDGRDPLHADRSALLALEFCDTHGIECNRSLLADTIRFHCKSGRFHWTDPPMEAKILADADRLDRFRFHSQYKPLDESMLLLPQSHFLIPLAAGVNGHPSAL